jgi:hypothetical protein
MVKSGAATEVTAPPCYTTIGTQTEVVEIETEHMESASPRNCLCLSSESSAVGTKIPNTLFQKHSGICFGAPKEERSQRRANCERSICQTPEVPPGSE